MNIVIVGGGLAGANAVEELRNQGYDGDITLVAAPRWFAAVPDAGRSARVNRDRRRASRSP
jgi:NADPH-dependent 2,4-dienoyl-CoA reductase/sulfur reductase-like enzyme